VLKGSLGLAVLTLLLVLGPARGAMASTAVPTGNDVSYPQCGQRLPAGQAFGIVGVNGGIATTTNPCLATELAWAGSSTGVTDQPKTQLYVNTANPGLASSVWPTSNVDPSGTLVADPYGNCTGQVDAACAYQYGWNRANDDVNVRLASVTGTPASSYVWYLDVETANSWSVDLVANRADLEGMTGYFTRVGATTGIYSTSSQWNTLVGSVDPASSLYALREWRPGARNLRGAQSNCSLSPLTGGGAVVLTQYTSGGLDYDVSCTAAARAVGARQPARPGTVRR
jgi:hypothetical protein